MGIKIRSEIDSLMLRKCKQNKTKKPRKSKIICPVWINQEKLDFGLLFIRFLSLEKYTQLHDSAKTLKQRRIDQDFHRQSILKQISEGNHFPYMD